MTNITLAVPDDLFKRMKAFKDIRWSEVARASIERRVQDLEVMNTLASKSRLTHEDVMEISKRMKVSAAKKF